MVSFGIFKRATCLGGAVVLLESVSLKNACSEIQGRYSVLPRAKFHKRWALGLLGKLVSSNALDYSVLDLIARCFRRRVSTVFLALGRSQYFSGDVEIYLYRPRAAIAQIVVTTLLSKQRPGQAVICCREMTSNYEVNSTGIWPKLALIRQAHVAQRKKAGFEGIPLSVRLSAIGSFREKSTKVLSSHMFLQRAFFVHPSFFEPQHEYEIDP